VKALLYGVRPDRWAAPDQDNRLLVGLSKVPMRLEELAQPVPLRDDWAVIKTRLTGICGSDAKQVFMDFGDDYTDSALNGLFTFPTVLGHEVVADVVEVGPAVTTVEVGQRVVLNPWLSCGPRGIDPPCGSCRDGDFSLCWHFTEGPLAAGIHTGTSKDAPGGFADYLPAHESMLLPVPESLSDEVAVLADPFAVSLHSVTRHPPPPGGKVLVYGSGALGITATAILRALHPDVEVMVVARFPAQAALARRLGATVVDPFPVEQLLVEAADWSGGVLQRVEGALPMAHPGGIDVVYDTVGTGETAAIGV
jgi:threonine dehydrogenase-like Zn-dependent dehydrogenase